MSDVTNDVYWVECGKQVGPTQCTCILSPGHLWRCECEHTIDTTEPEGTPDE